MSRINHDSKLWERAYNATTKTSNKPENGIVKSYKIKQRNIPKENLNFTFTKGDKVLKNRLIEIKSELKRLNKERAIILQQIKTRKVLNNKGIKRKVSLYALRLQNDCWYIGMSFNVDKRFKIHSKGKGATWTKKHKPIEIHEVRETEHYDQDSAVKFEDDMTIEYVLLYGSEKVRGGGWCQTKPHWPDVVIQNETHKIT